MKYKICLTSVIWSPDYQNVRRFVSRAAQEEYFGVANLFTSDVPERNLNAGTLVNLSIFVKNGEAGIGSIMENNYAIIKELDTGKFYYYFITNATFDSVNQTRLDLQLDVFQTYYLDMTFGDSMIERAHLNRWDNSGAFSKEINTPLFLRDEIKNVPKRIKSQIESVVSPFTPTNAASEWIDSNVYAWIYAFLDAGTYTWRLQSYSHQMTYRSPRLSQAPRDIVSPYVVICCPILNDSTKSITISGKAFNMDDFFDFVNSNIGHVYTMKVSQITPFSSTNTAVSSVDANTLALTSTGIDVVSTNVGEHIIMFVNNQELRMQYLTKSYTLPQQNITKASIDTYAKDLVANPKAYNNDFRALKIQYGGNAYEFDLQKLYASVSSSGVMNFAYFEVITAEIVPTMIAPIVRSANTNPLYNYAIRDIIGYCSANDFTLPFSKDQLSVFLANNKNFFNQKEQQYILQKSQRAVSGISNLLSSGAGIAGSAVVGDIGGAVKQGFGAVLGLGANIMSSEMQIYYDKQNTQMTLDNMESGVDALAAANSNVFFNLTINDLKILLIESEALPHDLAVAEEDMHENGYVYNRMGNIKDFDSIRKKWNFVKARVEIIKTPVRLPNSVREIVKAAFERGIRFWETDDVRFNQTNLE